MFRRNPEAKAQRKADKQALKAWRANHPSEATMNGVALFTTWPASKYGMTYFGPVAGASAELFNANAHKAWTATRLATNALTLGGIPMGRKNKGAAAINIVFADGTVKVYNVTPEKLASANTYVTAFNALSGQLMAENMTTPQE